MLASKLRLRFAKRGDLRLVSHHDLMRCLERTLRRARIPMAHSQGFNPRPKMVFPLALGLGIEGRREVLELELAEPMEPAEALRRLQAAAPPGFDFLEAEPAGPGRAAQIVAARYTLDVPPDRRDQARSALARLLASPRWIYTRHRPGRTVEADLRPFVLEGSLDEAGSLQLRLKITPEGSVRPEEVLDALGLRDLLDRGAVLARTEVELSVPSSPASQPLSVTRGDRAAPSLDAV
jgi:radical SAM-linked protein